MQGESNNINKFNINESKLLINEEIKIKNIFAFYYKNYKLYMKAKELIKN